MYYTSWTHLSHDLYGPFIAKIIGKSLYARSEWGCRTPYGTYRITQGPARDVILNYFVTRNILLSSLKRIKWKRSLPKKWYESTINSFKFVWPYDQMCSLRLCFVRSGQNLVGGKIENNINKLTYLVRSFLLRPEKEQWKTQPSESWCSNNLSSQFEGKVSTICRKNNIYLACVEIPALLFFLEKKGHRLRAPSLKVGYVNVTIRSGALL